MIFDGKIGNKIINQNIFRSVQIRVHNYPLGGRLNWTKLQLQRRASRWWQSLHLQHSRTFTDTRDRQPVPNHWLSMKLQPYWLTSCGRVWGRVEQASVTVRRESFQYWKCDLVSGELTCARAKKKKQKRKTRIVWILRTQWLYSTASMSEITLSKQPEK